MACEFYLGQRVRFVGMLWCHWCGSLAREGCIGLFIGHTFDNGQTLDNFEILPVICLQCGLRLTVVERPCGGGGFTHPLFELVEIPIYDELLEISGGRDGESE